jgi:hypothetical protein
MFDFLFKKKTPEIAEKPQEQDTDHNVLASITYHILDDGSGTPMIDIGLSDYNSESFNALCKILDILSQDSSYLETIEMVKNGLVKEGQEEALIQIFTHISEQAGKKIIRSTKESTKDQPCIKPSDMLK